MKIVKFQVLITWLNNIDEIKDIDTNKIIQELINKIKDKNEKILLN